MTVTEKLTQEDNEYLLYHKQRFAYLIKKVDELVNELGKTKPMILDIGPHFQTTLLRAHFGDKVIINTLGWENSNTIVPDGTVDKHYHFDLNDTSSVDKWVKCPQHDIILMAEVFEHLYTAPEYFMSFLNASLYKNGFLMVGTPNGVALSKRITLLKGSNPYEKIRTTLDNPGHFREYTLEELIEYGNRAGLETYSAELMDFYPQGKKAAFLKKVFPKLKDSINIIYRKKS